jgi:hypothetical protein
MKITKVYYSALANLGDYNNERIGMTAILEPDENPEQAVQQLRERVIPLCGPKLRELRDLKWELSSKIGELKQKLADYQRQWDSAAEFLRAQGIKPDAPNFPQFDKLLSPSPIQEESSVIEGEMDEEYDEYEEP